MRQPTPASNPAPEDGSSPHIGRSVLIDQAAELLGVSRRTIYNRISDGHLQTVRTLGGSQRVTLESVIDMGGRRPETFSNETGKDTRGNTARAVVTLLLLAVSVQPALAQRRARLSEDLADHLAAGSQTIDVIVHGNAEGRGRAAEYQPACRAAE